MSHKRSCMSQVARLRASSGSYNAEVVRLEEVLLTATTASLRRDGFGYLVTLWYQTATRDCGRAGFANLVEFAEYVGPRPTPRHQLHRLDNSRPYERGNVQWQLQVRGGVQALVKGNARPHRWCGKRLSHAELAADIVKRGGRATEGSIAKQYQRYRRRLQANQVTEAIVKQHGIPFARATCPLENWDFPPELAKAAYAYAQYHDGRTRLDFAIAWLEDCAVDAAKSAEDDRLDASTQQLYRRVAKHYAGYAGDLERDRAGLLRLKAEQAAVNARLCYKDVSCVRSPDPLQLDLFAGCSTLPEPEAERFPTLDEAEEILAPFGPVSEMRLLCEAAIEAGLPYPYRHHPHYKYPNEHPPATAVVAVKRELARRKSRDKDSDKSNLR